MPMRTPKSNSPKVFISEVPPQVLIERELEERKQVRGDPGSVGVGDTPPPATRTTAQPYAETADRKPYLPTEDTSTPGLDEGVSFRQRI